MTSQQEGAKGTLIFKRKRKWEKIETKQKQYEITEYTRLNIK